MLTKKNISAIQNIQKPEAKVACLNLFFPKISKIHLKITYQSPLGPGCFWFLLDSPWFSGFTGSFFSALLGGSQVTETSTAMQRMVPLSAKKSEEIFNSWSVARDDISKNNRRNVSSERSEKKNHPMHVYQFFQG